MVEVGGRAGGAPPSAAGLRVNRGADTTTAQGWPSTSTYRVGDQLISAPERFLGSVTEGQIDTLPNSTSPAGHATASPALEEDLPGGISRGSTSWMAARTGGGGLTGCPQSTASSRSAAWNSSSKVSASARRQRCRSSAAARDARTWAGTEQLVLGRGGRSGGSVGRLGAELGTEPEGPVRFPGWGRAVRVLRPAGPVLARQRSRSKGSLRPARADHLFITANPNHRGSTPAGGPLGVARRSGGKNLIDCSTRTPSTRSLTDAAPPDPWVHPVRPGSLGPGYAWKRCVRPVPAADAGRRTVHRGR